jgi:tRNA threonylcarbamoyladenosine biosynthesis protein TsaB
VPQSRNSKGNPNRAHNSESRSFAALRDDNQKSKCKLFWWAQGRYARGVDVLSGKARLLLIDTCGETAGIAVCLGGRVLAADDFAPGCASAEVVAAIRRLLAQVGWRLAELDAVGVVSGPGSFTGMRAGLAAAKGLCEAARLRLVAVSRLVVLADAASAKEGADLRFVALDAGRGELYVRQVGSGQEWVGGDGKLLGLVAENGRCEIAVAEERVAERLAACGPLLCPLRVGDALGVVLRRLAEGGDDAAVVDANYVRGEGDIYGKSAEAVKAVIAGA